MIKGVLAIVVVGVLIGAGAWLSNRPGPQWQPISAADAATKIEWQPSLEAAITEARRSGKPIVADFFATWCGPCKMMDQQTYPDPRVAAEAERWVMVQIDVDKHPEIAQRYRASALPTIAFLKSDGTPVTGFQGFAPPEDMLNMMQQAYPKTQ